MYPQFFAKLGMFSVQTELLYYEFCWLDPDPNIKKKFGSGASPKNVLIGNI